MRFDDAELVFHAVKLNQHESHSLHDGHDGELGVCAENVERQVRLGLADRIGANGQIVFPKIVGDRSLCSSTRTQVAGLDGPGLGNEGDGYFRGLHVLQLLLGYVAKCTFQDVNMAWLYIIQGEL